jgi:4'-phosphopantetheinyl transferase
MSETEKTPFLLPARDNWGCGCLVNSLDHTGAEPKFGLWQARLDRSAEERQYFASLLSAEEQARSQRLKHPTHQQRFMTARGLLRLLLADQVGLKPDRLEFAYGHRGKPSLSNPEIAHLQFNLSHSHDHVLYAISISHRIGIDVEIVRLMPNVLALANRFFTAAESAAIAAVSEVERSRTFLRYWTCKEAYLKATGDGLGKIQDLEIQIQSTQCQDALMTRADVIHQTTRAGMGQIWKLNLSELNLGASLVGAIALLQA